MRTSPMAIAAAALFVGACARPDSEPPSSLLDQSYVVFSPSFESGLASPVVLANEARPALVADTPAEFRYRLRIPERPFLTFALGIVETGVPDEADLPGNRIHFSVHAGVEAPDEIVFERGIHVARRGQWIEQSVDLGRFAGREIWLSFRTSLPEAEPGAPLPVAGVFGEPVLHDRARYREGRAVVVISIDTLRRDHTSLYGYPRRTTPGLEALAEEAIVFDDAVSTSSWTLPAHASLFTSTYPSVHGAVNLNVGLSPEWPNLVRLLREEGFFTQAFVTHLYLSREYGFGEGFERHVYLPETRAEELTRQAVGFLEAKGDRDFFLFLHYYDPHWHYDPPAPYDGVFDPSYDGSASGVWWDFKELDADSIDPRDLHHIVALYDGEILYTDRQVERLFQEMKRLGVFDKALIVVTSDHGEEFLEHGSWEHQKTLYEEQLRIPLVMKLPRSESAGRRVSRQVSLIDIAPTIAEVMGIPIPASYQGRGLLEAVHRPPSDEPREVWAETEHTLDGSHKIAIRRGARSPKAIFRLEGENVEGELFDLSEDASERHGEENSERLAAYRRRLEAYLKEAAKRREGKPASPEVELDREAIERLRALGYVR